MKKEVNKRLDHIVNNLINEKKSFTLYLSQNSQSIVLSGKKTFFSAKKLNPKIFQVSKKIKKESEDFLAENDQYNNREERRKINYFNYKPFKNLKRFYFVDIKSAYITSLFNLKIISEDLLKEVNSLKKHERLIALGILAFEPYEVIYIDGVQISMKRLSNPYSTVFFKACATIADIMNELIRRIDDRFIFYWVDGIFFESQKDYFDIKNYLDTLGYEYRFGSCFDLKYKECVNHYKISFWQADKGKLEKKNYSIPFYFAEQDEKKKNYELIQAGNFKELLLNYRKKINQDNNKNSR